MVKPGSVIFVFLLLLSLKGIPQTASLDVDSLAEKKAMGLVGEYLEVFAISYSGGVYHSSYETRFRNLFDENARIVNFFPGSSGYLSEITTSEYISLVKDILIDRIIQLHLWEASIVRIEKLQDSYDYQIEVAVNKKIAVYQKDGEFIGALLNEFDVNLVIQAKISLSEGKSKIQKISRNHALVDLSFRVLFPGREPATRLPIDFFYKDGDQRIIRRRFTNNEGKMAISYLPEKSVLKMVPPKGYRFLLSESYTVEVWKNVPEQERLLFISENPIQIKPQGRLFIDVGYFFPVFLDSGTLLNSQTLVDYQDHVVNQSGGFGVKLNLSFAILKKPGFFVAIGSGIEHKDIRFESAFGSLTQHFSNMIDSDSDTFLLELTGKNVYEQFETSLTSIPFSLSVHFPLKGRFFNELSFNSNLNYLLSNQIEYAVSLEQTSRGYYHAYDLLMTDVLQYHFQTDLVIPEGVIEGKTSGISKTAFSFGMAFKFRFIKEFLNLTYYIDYHSLNLGKKYPGYFFPLEGEQGYFLNPSLVSGHRFFGQLNMGLGLTVLF